MMYRHMPNERTLKVGQSISKGGWALGGCLAPLPPLPVPHAACARPPSPGAGLATGATPASQQLWHHSLNPAHCWRSQQRACSLWQLPAGLPRRRALRCRQWDPCSCSAAQQLPWASAGH